MTACFIQLYIRMMEYKIARMIAMKQEMLYSLIISSFRFSSNISFQNTIGIYTYIIKDFPYYTHQKQIKHFTL